jgi:aryl-phospho-beta-D-glucosidase BglC (GH1 family)
MPSHTYVFRHGSRAALLLVWCAVSACGGGGSQASRGVAGIPAQTNTQHVSISLSIAIPQSSVGRLPRYISAATKSVRVVVTPAAGGAFAPVTVNCSATCDAVVDAALGSNTFDLKLFDQQNAAGNVLSQGSVTQTILEGKANTVLITLGGVVAKITVGIAPPTISSAGSVTVTVTAQDAAGRTIIGAEPYVNPISLTDTDASGSTSLSTRSVTSPATTVALSYNGSASFSTAVIGATASGVPAASVVSATLTNGGQVLKVAVAGNHLVDSAGNVLTLRGADISATEYVCAQGWSSDPYGGAPLADVSTYQAMRTWHINVIRVPLNEDCWLGINGVTVGGAAYRTAIANEVSAAHQAGMYVILDLHWSAPGSQLALSQNPFPDQDHSPAFWSSVASAFKNDPAVIFDLFNEPFDYWGTGSDHWAGWLNGETQTQYTTGGSSNVTASWKTAGMQQLIDVVRAAGAAQPVLVNGLDWGNDDSGWLAHAPSDPAGQLIAGAHIYPGQGCSAASCWNAVYPALQSKYPVLIGETGDNSAAPVSSFLPAFLNYADANHWSYLAWTWDVWTNSSNVLITGWDGTPTTGEGATYKAHLLTSAP